MHRDGRGEDRLVPEARCRDSLPDPTHGAGESDVEPPPHPGGTRPARLRGRRADRRQVRAPDLASAVIGETRTARLRRPRGAIEWRVEPPLPPGETPAQLCPRSLA